jgi:sulfate permease, SulP family
MLIPQGMAYAMLAGLPPIMGLYASTVPLLVYAALGTSRQLSVGPLAMASLMMAGGIHELVPEGDPAQIVATAILLTLVAGASQILMGVFRLGGLVNLLSHPVVTGFTGAAAIIIGASQLTHVVGFSVPRGTGPFGTFVHIGTHLGTAHVLTVAVALLGIAVIVGVRRYNARVGTRYPAALVAVVLGIVASFLMDFEGRGVAVLGQIPSGLPSPMVPSLSVPAVVAALPMGVAVGLIGFMESISAARIYARQNRYEIGAGQELIALGAANITAGVFGGYTVGGALSRTAVNAQAGAKTPLANVVTGVAIVLTLLFLTPLFYYLPTPILASIILVAVTGLFDFSEWAHLWRVKRDDLALLVVTFCATLFLSIELGIVIGVVASLLWLVFTTTRPVISTLGRIPNTRSYRCLDHFDEAETARRILILRMDAQFFFGNIRYLKDALYRRLEGIKEPVAVVLDASSINGLDSTAADALRELIPELRAQHVEVFVSHLKGAVLSTMRETGILDELGEGHVFYEVHDAVMAALRHREAVEAGIPEAEEDFGPSDMMD